MSGSFTSSEARHRTHRRLKTALILNTLVIVIEVAGGFYANSLSLLSDGVHNIIDEASLALTFFTYYIATRPASGKKPSATTRWKPWRHGSIQLSWPW